MGMEGEGVLPKLKGMEWYSNSEEDVNNMIKRISLSLKAWPYIFFEPLECVFFRLETP